MDRLDKVMKAELASIVSRRRLCGLPVECSRWVPLNSHHKRSVLLVVQQCMYLQKMTMTRSQTTRRSPCVQGGAPDSSDRLPADVRGLDDTVFPRHLLHTSCCRTWHAEDQSVSPWSLTCKSNPPLRRSLGFASRVGAYGRRPFQLGSSARSQHQVLKPPQSLQKNPGPADHDAADHIGTFCHRWECFQ